MSDTSNRSMQIQGWINRLQAGDESARRELLNSACERLTRLTRKMLQSYPRLKRWEQTDDVLQNALLRLYRSLAEVKPTTTAAFFRLAAVNVRRELLDLAKHYFGPCGLGAQHQTVQALTPSQEDNPQANEPSARSPDPGSLASWTEFHARIEQLPDEEREVFDLLWYQELSQVEAAALLNISERTIKRRWAAARLALHQLVGGTLPDTPGS
jgi:RNA polymerase sigma-70 factor (ECF subfamily)